MATPPLRPNRGSEGDETRGIRVKEDPGGGVAGPGTYSAVDSGRQDSITINNARDCRAATDPGFARGIIASALSESPLMGVWELSGIPRRGVQGHRGEESCSSIFIQKT